MKTFMTSLFEISLFSSVLILAVLHIKAVFKNKISLKIISVLWIAVLLRLIMPYAIASPVHLDGIAAVIGKERYVEEATVAVPTKTEAEKTENAPARQGEPEIFLVPKEEKMSETVSAAQPAKARTSKIVSDYIKSNIWAILFAAWISGLAAFLVKLTRSLAKFDARTGECGDIISPEVLKIFKETKNRLGIRKEVKLLSSRYVSVPVTFGWIRPKILLPSDLEKAISEEKLKLILMHELLHVKRNDLLKNYIWIIAKLVHWFNPLVWKAYREYNDDIELAVDNEIVKFLDKKGVYDYSQSIIEVVRLSKKPCNVPVAVSFCSDRTKLKKRMENMLVQTKKQKTAAVVSVLFAAVMIFICFTTACQPTPEELIVQNKADDDLKEAIEQTAVPEETSAAEENAEQTDSAQSEFIKSRFGNNYTNNTGNITVNFDADVLIPNTPNIPVAYVEEDTITQQELDRLLKVLFKGEQLYDISQLTKSDYEDRIVRMEKDAMDLTSDLAQSNGITKLEDLREEADRLIALYWKRWENAPETKQEINSPDINDTEHQLLGADLGRDTNAQLIYSAGSFEFTNFGTDFNFEREMPETAIAINMETEATPEALDAQQKALAFIKEAGIEGVKLANTMYYEEIVEVFDSGTGEDISTYMKSGKVFYIASFERAVGDMSIDRSYYSGNHCEDDSPFRPVSYERMDLWFEDGEIVQFLWKSPHKITNMVNESVQLQVDFDTAVELMLQQAYVKYADVAYYRDMGEIIVNVDRVELSLARVLERNTGNYIVVPVWDFYGEVLMGSPGEEGKETCSDKIKRKDGYYPYGLSYLEYLNDCHQKSIITLNALDSSIIDRKLGY